MMPRALQTCFLVTVNLLVGASASAMGERKIFQCSELDHLSTPVDVGFKTDNGFVIRRYDENGLLVGTVAFADADVDYEDRDGHIRLQSKSEAGAVYVSLQVRGHGSSLVIRSPEINVSRPRAGSLVCTY